MQASQKVHALLEKGSLRLTAPLERQLENVYFRSLEIEAMELSSNADCYKKKGQ